VIQRPEAEQGREGRHPGYSLAQQPTAEVAAVTTAAAGGLIAIGLWLWTATAALIVSGLAWLAGLGAIVLLFSAESGPFYQHKPATRPG